MSESDNDCYARHVVCPHGWMDNLTFVCHRTDNGFETSATWLVCRACISEIAAIEIKKLRN